MCTAQDHLCLILFDAGDYIIDEDKEPRFHVLHTHTGYILYDI